MKLVFPLDILITFLFHVPASEKNDLSRLAPILVKFEPELSNKESLGHTISNIKFSFSFSAFPRQQSQMNDLVICLSDCCNFFFSSIHYYCKGLCLCGLFIAFKAFLCSFQCNTVRCQIIGLASATSQLSNRRSNRQNWF